MNADPLKVGLLGGSFDPVHFGHMHVALQMQEKHGLDEVWWLPAKNSPLKTTTKTSMAHRLEMVRLALEPLPSFRVCAIEDERPAPSYTIDTMRLLQAGHPAVAFSLLLGQDAAASFDQWKEAKALALSFPLFVAARENSPLTLTHETPLREALARGWTPMPLMQVSSSDIRDRLRRELYCGHLAPAKVLDYIARHHLYYKY